MSTENLNYSISWWIPSLKNEILSTPKFSGGEQSTTHLTPTLPPRDFMKSGILVTKTTVRNFE